MALNDARRFVDKMKQDSDFRNQAQKVGPPEDLAVFLSKEELRFNQGELVGAMAECMAQMEDQAVS